MKRWIAVIAAAAVLGATTVAGAADSTPPTPAQEKVWLTNQFVQDYIDARNWDAERTALDYNTIRPLREQFRSLLLPIIAETSGQAQLDAQHALDVLAAPGPAPSVAKTIHEETRRFGADALQILNRHTTAAGQRLAFYP